MGTELLRQCRIGLWLLPIAAGCGSSASVGSATGAGGALGNAAMAAALWTTTGCKLQGCPYGSYCNKTTGFCDTRTCNEGCPEGTTCNEGLKRCQAPAPASPPNDFLPQDEELRRGTP